MQKAVSQGTAFLLYAGLIKKALVCKSNDYAAHNLSLDLLINNSSVRTWKKEGEIKQ